MRSKACIRDGKEFLMKHMEMFSFAAAAAGDRVKPVCHLSSFCLGQI